MSTFELWLLSVFIVCLSMYGAVCGAEWLARELWLKLSAPSRWDSALQKAVEALRRWRQAFAGATATMLAAFLTVFLATRLMHVLLRYV